MQRFWIVFLGGPLLAATGCGGDGAVAPVSGTVTLDGLPLAGALLVVFSPEGDTTGQGGTATTEADGKYVLKSAKGGKGLPLGHYRVTVSKRLNPDGSVPSPDVPPIESNARETMPNHYSDSMQTKLKANVAAGGKPVDFKLESAKKK